MPLLKRFGELMARSSCAALSPRVPGEAARRRQMLLAQWLPVRLAGLTGTFAGVGFHRLSLVIAFLFVTASATAQVQLPESNTTEPVVATAESGNQWQLGSYEVWVLRGNCVIQQGASYARSREAVLWIDRADAMEHRQHKVIAYLEGNVEIMLDRRPGATRLTDRAWLGRFSSSAGVQVRAAATMGKPDVLPPIYWRGMERRAPESAEDRLRSRVQPAQYLAPAPPVRPNVQPALSGPAAPPATAAGLPGPAPAPMAAPGGPPAASAPGRRVQVFARSDVPVQINWFPDPASNQWVAVIDSGVNVIVDGIPGFGTIDILTDRLVIWTTSPQTPDLNRPTVQDQRTPLEFYMEGNIVFREGERTIYADRMYYDVPNHVGTILNADVLTPVRTYQGLLRLHADVVQQTAPDRYLAKDAFLTSSRMGEPGYRFQSNDVYFEDIQRSPVDPVTGLPLVDAAGQPIVEHQRMATASNDLLYLGPVPIFYWPVMATDLNEPTYYIRSAQLRQDTVFGTQILSHWNGYQLLGIQDKPKGTDLDLGLDYLSKRGFGYGASFHYGRESLFDVPGRTDGLIDFWGIQDNGLDNLGSTRMNVQPEASYRYRLFGQHREMLPYDIQLSAELGFISDRNFVEEYYKNEWDTLKDETTGLELKRISGDSSLSVTADVRVNDFFTQTNWLPRADHFWLGQPLFGDALTWYEHSSAGYAQFRQLTVPENTATDGPFNFLPWEANNVQGGRFVTRQEIDWPFQLGAVKVVPYALGEAAHWDEDINGNPLDRLFGQAGVRASLPMWSVDPTITSDLFNVHGIAHKVVFNAEFSYAQANQNLQSLPLYDPLDDDSVEAFRRMFLTTTFGIPTLSPLPTPPGTPWVPAFDERLYALRTGLQDWVTSPSTEIAGDLAALRLGVQQRWQTKRGPPDDPHIIDWITLDTNATFYPDDTRDNFGQPVGLLDYDFRWHVGDRLTLLSDAIFDFFDQGQKLFSVGAFLNRPPRGSLYAGFRVLEGPIDSKVISLTYSYWMSPKWVSSFGTSIDLAQQGNLGESFTIMRVGESLLVSVGFSADPIRKSVGASLAIEPRFLPRNRLGNVGGAEIPPAGAFGLE
jgi:hypothetical protein